MVQRKIFYSWQTDSDARCNRNFIEDCLKRAIKKLNREDLSDLVVDRDTRNVPGMPDIGHTILDKIANSAIVVADLTLINPAAVRRADERPVPNPNVLFELGYAVGKLGTKAIVAVFNTASGNIEELPFDLRPKRLLAFRLDDTGNKSEARENLVDSLSAAIRQCIGETDEEITKRNSRIYRLATELLIFGAEIDEWHGVGQLRDIMQGNLTQARELASLMQLGSYSDDSLGRVRFIVFALENATAITLNDENWPTIKHHISEAAGTVEFIRELQGFKIAQSYHDALIENIKAMPTALDEQILNLQNGPVHIAELGNIAYSLRAASLKALVPQHPKFAIELKEISLGFRKLVLSWAKATPTKTDAGAAIRDIREQLTHLIATYVTGNHLDP